MQSACNWQDQTIPAILEAWYPGEEGGAAIADVLFGDYNPGGKLPVTFYRSVDDLPAFEDYRMEGRTYRYFRGEPLYPFGHGLSYAIFDLGGLRVESGQVSFEVRNASFYDGDAVVQVFAKPQIQGNGTEIKRLIGFKRLHLRAGESQSVTISTALIREGEDVFAIM